MERYMKYKLNARLLFLTTALVFTRKNQGRRNKGKGAFRLFDGTGHFAWPLIGMRFLVGP